MQKDVLFVLSEVTGRQIYKTISSLYLIIMSGLASITVASTNDENIPASPLLDGPERRFDCDQGPQKVQWSLLVVR